MQRLYLIFILNSQQPTHIRGYGGILCTRDNFKMVICFDRAQNKKNVKINLFYDLFLH